jgi:hypothetical protein
MDQKPTTYSHSRPPFQGPPLDLTSWKNKEYWSISEAVKLICGRNPYEKTPGMQLHNRGRRVIDIIDQAFAAAQRGEMKLVRNGMLAVHSLVEPASFIRWAIKNQLEVPEGLLILAEVNVVTNPEIKEALCKERIQTIASTLWILQPELDVNAVANHGAMSKLVTDGAISPAKKLEWILEVAR